MTLKKLITMSAADLIAVLRKRGMTLVDVAELAGITQGMVSQITLDYAKTNEFVWRSIANEVDSSLQLPTGSELIAILCSDGFSLKDVSERCEISKGNLSMIKNGKVNAGESAYRRLAKLATQKKLC